MDDSASTQEGVSVDIDVLANDSDPEGDVLSITSFTSSSSGTVTDNGGGTLKYTPHLGFIGQDSFSYTVSDGNGGFDTATVTVDVTGSNGPDPFSTPIPSDEDGDASGEGPVPSNEGEPINQPEEIPPSNDNGDENGDGQGEGQQAGTLGTNGEVPDIEIVFETPGVTLQLDETFDNLGGPTPLLPTPAPQGPVPSNDDP